MADLYLWDGNPSELPEMGKPFIYNGEQYVWERCLCGCEKPLGFLGNEVEDRDFEMTVRLRGKDQGDPLASVLVKLGKMEEMIQTKGNPHAIGKVLNDYLGEAGVQSTNDFDEKVELFASKGIAIEELYLALAEAVGIPIELAMLMVI